MAAFDYLSVLVSLIIGLGLSHLLASTARLIQLRHRVRLHAPTLLWMVFLFLVQVQIWWAAFGDRAEADWNFFGFLSFLLIPVLAYLLTYLLVPDLETDERIDLEVSFRRNRAWFFGLLGVAISLSLGRDLFEDGLRAFDLDGAFRIGFLALSVGGSRLERTGPQTACAALAVVSFAAYIGALFLRLE